MFLNLWRLVRNIAITLGVMVSIVFLSELARLLAFLFQLSPILGYAGVLACAIVCVAIVLRLLRAWYRYPRILSPPPIGDIETASHENLRDYCRYLSRYLRQLTTNPNLSAEARAQAREGMEYISDTLRHHPLNEDLRMCFRKLHEETIKPILSGLMDIAEKQVRDSVRDVMAGVMLSPYPSLDLLIVLYRNFTMVGRIMNVFRSRPAAREQWLIFRDIFAVVATVNFVNLNRKLIENMGAQIPMLGRFIDVLVQGVGAGVFTSITGHAAIARCAAFEPWDREHQRARMAEHSAQFLRDVRLMLTKDLLHELKPRILTTVSAIETERPGFWEALENGIRAAVDLTARSCEAWMMRPVVAGVQGVASLTGAAARTAARQSVRLFKASAKGSSRVWRSITRAMGTFTERVKYTIIGRQINRWYSRNSSYDP